MNKELEKIFDGSDSILEAYIAALMYAMVEFVFKVCEVTVDLWDE